MAFTPDEEKEFQRRRAGIKKIVAQKGGPNMTVIIARGKIDPADFEFMTLGVNTTAHARRHL